ncbi:hypothetical protein VSX64_19765 [Aurantimonas sp. C2-6-R+9]|uniref:hypothetical protein n=1 Tax=unclassified Aurantimonas TaxID=2638230 RepID=UPI002E18F3E9|nr:hypothetical protein [Aurantimonas sp. C2-6-R+9]
MSVEDDDEEGNSERDREKEVMDDQGRLKELFERAKLGEITGEEADAEAIRLGLGSLSRQPGADDYRPEAQTHWTLPMAVAWIAYLDLNEVREWSALYRAECFDWLWQRCRRGLDGPIYEGWHLEQRSKPTLALLGISAAIDRAEGEEALNMSIREAQEALWIALREGFFTASGIDTETNRRVEIPGLEWHELVAVEGRGEADEVRRGMMSTGYRDVLVPSVAVRGFWRRPVERVERLPPTVHPDGDGFMPLVCAAQWIATEGGGVQFDPADESRWAHAYDLLLSAIASEGVRVVGTRAGVREPVPGYHFAGCRVDYPFSDAPLDMIMSEDLYLRSYPYIDDEHWRSGFYDALMNRSHEFWVRLMVEKGDVRARWPVPALAEVVQAAAAEEAKLATSTSEPIYQTGLPGRPTSKHLWMAEAKRRIANGEVGDTRTKFCEDLSEWLKATHPHAAQITSKTLLNESELRSLFNLAKSSA